MNQFHKMDRDEERESAYIASIGKYRKKITDLRLKMAELQTKVDLYEKYISYCIDHDSVELGEVYSFNGELYRMVSREAMTEKGIEFTYLENSSSCPHCHCRLYDADESDKNALRRSSEYWKAKCKLLELERRK